MPSKQHALWAAIAVSVAAISFSLALSVAQDQPATAPAIEPSSGELLLESPAVSAGDGANLVELVRQTMARRAQELMPAPATRPETQPETRPETQPAAESQPASQTAGLPSPTSQPETQESPATQPASQTLPTSQPDSHPEPLPATQPETHPAVPLGMRPEPQADSRPVVEGRPAGPDPLAGLAGRNYTVALTLRKGANVVFRGVCGGQGVVGNTEALALQAMAAPALGDKTSVEALQELTIEVEVLGVEKPVGDEGLADRLTPGLTGLKFARGEQAAYVLPSEAVAAGMTGEQMVQQCQGRLGGAADRAGRQASLFASRHFVALPRARAVALYRGKVLFRAGELDENMMTFAARRVGNYLVGVQDQEGCYRVGAEAPRMRDHLLATYAMAKLARHTGYAPLRQSAGKAIDFTMQSVKTTDTSAYVATPNSEEQLGATAMLLLARRRLHGEGRSQEIDGKLLAGLRGALTAEHLFRGKLEDAEGKAVAGTDAFLAYAAVWVGTSSESDRKKALDPVREALAGTEVSSAQESLWAAWAGVGLRRVIRPVRHDEQGPLDEVGGFAEPLPGAAATTPLTAMMLVSGRRFNAAGEPAAAQTNQIAGHYVAARLFLQQMTYKPREAYLADQPATWVGGVRQAADSSRITLEACAWAIEAMLGGE